MGGERWSERCQVRTYLRVAAGTSFVSLCSLPLRPRRLPVHSDPDPRFPVVVLPRWHSVLAGCGVALWLVCFAWGMAERSRAFMAMSASLAALSLAGLIDARTARIWVVGDRLWVRRYAFWTRSFDIHDVSSVDYDPSDHFEIRFVHGRRLVFPGGGHNLAELTRALGEVDG